MTPQQLQMEMQMAQMRMQQAQQGKQVARDKKPSDIHFVVVSRENSIVVNAPPDKMAIIRDALHEIDVEPRRMPLMERMNRVQMYRLASIDPESLVQTLRDLGNLDYDTRLHVDEQNKGITVDASLADQLTIRSLIKKLDASDRRFEVIWLRRLPADGVAETIMAMVGVEEKKETSRPWYYGRRRGNDEPADLSKRFSVKADVVNNRLLLRANDVEMKEVNNLLVKLSEIPSEEGNPSRLRQMDALSPEQTRELMERLEKIWPNVSPNPLNIELELEAEPAAEGEDASVNSVAHERTAVAVLSPSQTTGKVLLTQLAPDRETADDPLANQLPFDSADADKDRRPSEPNESSDDPAAINISQGPDGRLVIASDDTKALNMLEELILQAAPRQKDYRTFRLRFAWPYFVVTNLREFFEKEDGDKSDSNRRGYFSYYWGGMNTSSDSEIGLGLSRRRPLKFIADSDTKSVIVIGGDAEQLEIVEELIEFYDKPPPVDSDTYRRTEIIQLKYSKAPVVATAVKDVYRDILSGNDKALANNQQKQGSPERVCNYKFGDEGDSEQTMPRWKEMLSIGVDELSNTLIVSAPRFLFDQVDALIKELDERAKPTSSVRVVRLDGKVNTAVVRQALANILGQPQAAAPPNGDKGRQQGQPPPDQAQPAVQP